MGSFVHSLSLRKLQYLRETLLAVDETGIIAFIVSECDFDEKPRSDSSNHGANGQQTRRGIKTEQDVQLILSQQGWEYAETQVVWLKRGEFIVPG